MPKPAVSRDAFRGLIAFYAAKAHHDHKHDGEYCVLKLFGSAQDIPDRLLQQCSDEAELLGSETIASTLEPRTREIANGCARYDHASDFLHVLLRDLELKEH
ncbi:MULTISPECIES: hypothetical protein [unclassified Bradyrhizobium]|uniref:hypothetical protein n=1 Tax=unclassified Bradyrhizobium TaxID=2631580 RepID=UPI001FF9468F|nr:MULTISPECIES: hypothetical protein [unclassified Bradyrhizobium]MCK1712880.1 hypothetical protein [Bradyrhizobium sp. 143]MCK1730754.1 hypothetical protein [Bradyrhizobium sp. 142]